MATVRSGAISSAYTAFGNTMGLVQGLNAFPIGVRESIGCWNPNTRQIEPEAYFTTIESTGPQMNFLGTLFDIDTGWFLASNVRAPLQHGILNLYSLVDKIQNKTITPDDFKLFMEDYKTGVAGLEDFPKYYGIAGGGAPVVQGPAMALPFDHYIGKVSFDAPPPTASRGNQGPFYTDIRDLFRAVAAIMGAYSNINYQFRDRNYIGGKDKMPDAVGASDDQDSWLDYLAGLSSLGRRTNVFNAIASAKNEEIERRAFTVSAGSIVGKKYSELPDAHAKTNNLADLLSSGPNSDAFDEVMYAGDSASVQKFLTDKGLGDIVKTAAIGVFLKNKEKVSTDIANVAALGSAEIKMASSYTPRNSSTQTDSYALEADFVSGFVNPVRKVMAIISTI